MSDVAQLESVAFEYLTGGADLDAYVRDRRRDGVSWRAIADEVATTTSGIVDVSHVTLIRRYGKATG